MIDRHHGMALFLMLAAAAPAGAAYNAFGGDAHWLYIMPDEPESDTLAFLMCRENYPIETHLGAIFDIGKGEHEAVSLTLSAGKATARIEGHSMPSAESEMTGGVELLAWLPSSHEAFAILASGQEIGLASGGQIDRFTLGAKATKALKAFLKKCG